LNVIDNGLEPDVPQSLANQSRPLRERNLRRGNQASRHRSRSFTTSTKKRSRRVARTTRKPRPARSMISATERGSRCWRRPSPSSPMTR
jgi:hypothetical protein